MQAVYKNVSPSGLQRKIITSAEIPNISFRLKGGIHLYLCYTSCKIGKIIGADSIGFLSLEACDKLAADSHCGFCKGCFCGKYPVDPPLVTEKNKFDQPIHGGKVRDDD